MEDLSQRGEIFRSKLIEDFQLLDTLKSKGDIESPRFYSNEVQGIFKFKIACFFLETKAKRFKLVIYDFLRALIDLRADIRRGFFATLNAPQPISILSRSTFFQIQ